MDDGWFGGKYQRTDTSGLGDWVADSRKLPGGIKGLLADAKRHDIRFGIWIEPEMCNERSELYERHPDWVINAKGRSLVGGRGGNQLVLDLANPKVQDFVFGVVDGLLTRYPQIAYIKWDANMSIVSHGSQYLSASDQSHLYIAYHEGLRKVLERIRAKYPDVVMQSLRQWWRTYRVGHPALFRRVVGQRRHRCTATHLYAVGHQLLLPRYWHGLARQRVAQSSDPPPYTPQVSLRCGYERPVGYGTAAQRHDRQRASLCP